jgi:hypothetical protein
LVLRNEIERIARSGFHHLAVGHDFGARFGPEPIIISRE